MYRTTFVNGFCADEQKLVQLPNGVVYGSLAAAVESFPELVARYYNTLTADTNDAVEALTAAFVQDGAFVYVPKGVRVELPIAVESRFCGADQAIATFGRNLFIFEEEVRPDWCSTTVRWIRRQCWPAEHGRCS